MLKLIMNRSFRFLSLPVFFLFSIILTFSSAAQVISSEEIDKLVLRTLEAFDVPGIAVAVVKDDKVIHSGGYGVRSLNTKQKVDSNTLFAIASNSKAFTAAALGMLVDEKKLDWNDRSMDADAYVMFSLDNTGKASGMTMEAISPLTDFSYDFHDLDFRR